ncbi:phosphatase PAP2 family protein [uncultured Clostridium sp.]|jgi:undecaprenyl-diphosphatase|uniref:phosphatase PAP2 family protein n=1 Tax=uncultured Clostridium sp. TaxID=59620 RepID=UPI00262AA921|nr:phosphatase PAP2 family protein [uncultured Clostridium sp.]
MGFLDTFNMAILNQFKDWHGPIIDKIMLAFTRIGTDGLVFLIIGLILLITVKHRKVGFMIFFASSINLVLVEFFKHIVKEPRPFLTHPELLNSVIGVAPHSYSFPSGHASAAFVGAFILAYYFKKWAIPVYLLAIAIAVSRPFLLVHYPTDVIAGAIIGIVSSILAFFFYRIILKRYFMGILRGLKIEKYRSKH